jgi:hypothetical protein
MFDTDEEWLDEDTYDDEDEWPNDSIIRCKWTMDGATTLTEAAARLHGYADWLLDKESKGHQLTSPIEDDYGFVSPMFEEDAIQDERSE